MTEDDARYGLVMSTLSAPDSESVKERALLADEGRVRRDSSRGRFIPAFDGLRFPLLPWLRRGGDRFTGWPAGVAASAVLVAVVLLINIGFTIWALGHQKVTNGFDVLYKGSCQRTESLSTWIHLAINVLSTGMLGASNYCEFWFPGCYLGLKKGPR